MSVRKSWVAVRSLLTEAASKPKQDRTAELAAFREMLRRKYGMLADGTEGIRADRQARGWSSSMPASRSSGC
jgi:hypothetical protein